jgi:glyoxylase I family protein
LGFQRLTHIGICVSDTECSLRFYRDVLGFRYVSELQVAGEPAETLLQLHDVELRATYLERDGVRIELLHYPSPGHRGSSEPRPMNQLGLTHLSFRVDDLESLCRELRAAGVAIQDRTRIDVTAVGVAAVFISDPDGTLIELVQAPGDPEAPPGG